MITVTYLGESYECTTAIKGSNYIHLLDSSGCMIASFDGISDFRGFSISGGSWCVPKSEGECKVAVIREDGTIAEGGHVCKDLLEGKTLTQAEYNALPEAEKKRENFVYIVTDAPFDDEIADATVKFTEASTRTNIVSGEKASVLFGKIRKWFSSLGNLAFKSKVSSGDYTAGSIKNADISTSAGIATSKISGLDNRLEALESHIGETLELEVVSHYYVAFSPEADSVYAISADGLTYMIYITDENQSAYSTSNITDGNTTHNRCSYVPDLSSVPNLGIGRGFAFLNGVTNSTITVRKIS